MTRRNDLTFAQGPFAGGEIVVVGFPRCRHRRIGESERVRVIFEALFEAERISFFVKRDRMFLAACEMPDHNSRQARFALDAQKIIRINRDFDDHAPPPVRDLVDPELPSRARQGRAHNFKIFGSICVGPDKKPVAAMFDVIAQTRCARLYEAGCCVAIGKIEQMAFGRIVIIDADDCEARRLAAPDMNEQARIARLEDAGVGRRIAAGPVPENFGRPVIFICPHIIKA